MERSLLEVAQALDGTVEGDPRIRIARVASLESAGAGDLAFFFDVKKSGALASTHAAALVCGPSAPATALPTIRVKNAKLALAKALTMFEEARPARGIHPTASVDATATIADGVEIGPNAVVEARARIGARTSIRGGAYLGESVVVGDDCLLYPGVIVLDRCEIGSRVVVNAGTVIGSDGFGFVAGETQHRKMPQLARVRIGDDVEIGANCTIDRGPLEDTLIEPGVKIDNLVHVGHNGRIGAKTLIAAQVGLSGSVSLGERVLVGGQAGFSDHTSVGSDSIVGSRAAVMKSFPACSKLGGTPARALRDSLKERAAARGLVAERDALRRLTKRVEELERRLRER